MSAARHASIKVSAAFADAARREAATFNRSLGGQIEYWAQLGRAVENAGLSIERVREALEGRLKIETLAEAEQNIFFEILGEQMDRPDAQLDRYYAEMRNRAGLVGDEPSGRRVRTTAGGGHEPIS